MTTSGRTPAAPSTNAQYDLLPCGVVLTDDRQVVTYVNERCVQWLGYSPEQLIGKRRFLDLLTGGGRILFDTLHLTRLELEEELAELQYEFNTAGGERVPLIINARRLTGPEGGFVYVLVPYDDRKKLEEELRKTKEAAEAADRAKSTFLSTMSHEIRTPLHAIIEGGNFLLKENPRPDQAELIVALRAAGRNLLAIVNDILDVTKLKAGKFELDPRPFHLREVIEHLRDTYEHLIRQKGLALRFRYPERGVPMLMGDAAKIGQVLNNLVSNAAKFTAAGEIVVNVDHQANGTHHELLFSVRDTGPGIPADRLEAIFEPFTQASARTNTRFGGTGLGLAISHQIVRAHHAELCVVSTVGKGSTFSFFLRLPAASDEDIAAAAPVFQVPETLAPLNHLRVLNVDDNHSNLMINARYFREWRLAFEQFASPLDALRVLEEQSFDLILLDLRMPEIDGYEFARRVRANPRPEIAGLPLIALSASASTEVSARMLDAGINGLVLKPFEPAYLHHLIQRYGEDRTVAFRPAEEVAREKPERPGYDFSQAEEIFAGDLEDYGRFLRQIVLDMEEARGELKRCAEDFDAERFKALYHNMLSTMRVFKLDEVADDFSAAKEVLKQGDKIAFIALADKLRRALHDFEKAVREHAETAA